MGLFGKSNGTGKLADVIRCDETSYLIWKWHPEGSVLGAERREYEIRWGSRLRVKDGEVAVFFYKQKDGTVQDFIIGPFDGFIQTVNFPVLTKIIGSLYDDKSPFQAEIYYINIANIVQIKFGVPYFDVYDPRYPDYGVPVAVRGTISFAIADYMGFVKLHRLQNFDLNDFEKQIRDAVCRYVKDAVANAPIRENIPVVQIESKIAMINNIVERDLQDRLNETFGVVTTGVDIGAIEIDKSSDNFDELIKITKDVAKMKVAAQTEADIKNIYDKQRIEAENYEETLRIQREEGGYAQHMQTRTANLGAYQVEKQTEVGVAGAEALGQMGANNTGSVQLGGDSGVGFNPAAMMTSIAMGSVVGQNMAGLMSNAMSGINQPPQSAMVPPPIPQTMYNVAINGQAAGPFDMDTLKQMALSGQFTTASLVWKPGMTAGATADTIEELKSVLANVMPPIS